MLLPWFGERTSLLFFALPWLAVAVLRREPTPRPAGASPVHRCGLALAAFVVVMRGRETSRRSSPVTWCCATGPPRSSPPREGEAQVTTRERQRNDELTPITKMMAHLPLASFERAAARRAHHLLRDGDHVSLGRLSWRIRHRVELDPERAAVCSIYHSDGGRAGVAARDLVSTTAAVTWNVHRRAL